jgi:hypothetical protein
MHNSKLLRVLRQFTKSERKSLQSFVQSVYHCHNRKISSLLIHFIETIDNDTNNENLKFERSFVWTQISPKEPFNYDYLRKIASDSIKIIEEFMIIEQLKKDVNVKTHLLLENSKNRDSSLLQEIAIDRYEQNKSLFFSRRNSVNIYNTQILKNLFILKDFDKVRYQESGIDQIIFELDKFYITEKLKLLCDLLSRNWDLDITNFTLFNNILDLIANNSAYNVPSILVYYYIYLTISYPEEVDHYYKLKDTLLKHYHEFDSYEAKSIFDATVSYGIGRINSGDTNFLRETFELYQQGLVNGMLVYNNKIDSYNFKIIVVIGLRLAEYTWIEYFIESYKDMIPEEERENTVSYNLSTLYFYKKDFNKVLSLLQQIEYEDLTYNLGAKSMLLATYYELDEFEPLHSLLDSFKVFLNRKKSKIPSSTITNYQNLIKFTRRLLSVNAGDETSLNKLEADINKSEGVASIKWLREKIEQLR